jgi:hypothetical protein
MIQQQQAKQQQQENHDKLTVLDSSGRYRGTVVVFLLILRGKDDWSLVLWNAAASLGRESHQHHSTDADEEIVEDVLERKKKVRLVWASGLASDT